MHRTLSSSATRPLLALVFTWFSARVSARFLAGFVAGFLALSSWGHLAHAQNAPAASVPLAISSISPLPVDFGFVSVRASLGAREKLVTVSNLGSQDLVISEVSATDPVLLSVEWLPKGHARLANATLPCDGVNLPFDPIATGQCAVLLVTFSPTVANPLDSSLLIRSNDALNPEYLLPVKGNAVDVQITITPAHRLLLPNQTLRFAAQVTGTPNTGVTWAVTPAGVGGSISASLGTYTAPTTPITEATITATSTVDPLTSSSATVRVFSSNTAQAPAASLGAGRLGSVTRSADLDGDSLIEVISGAPLADVGTTIGAGQVWIRAFDGQGFSQAPVLLTAPTPGTGGGFGSAILLGDFDADGLQDLVIGEPGGGANGGGVVHLFAGFNGTGFNKHGSVASPAAGIRFGAALAIGTLSGRTGAGALKQNIAVGAPNATVLGLAGAGTVYLATVQDATINPIIMGLEPSTPLTAPTPQAGAGFGATLAAACINQCTQLGLTDEAGQINDLIIGAPNADVDQAGVTLIDAGQVFAAKDATVAGVTQFLAQMDEVSSPAPAQGAHFGASIAAADMVLNALSDLAIGAPGQPVTESGQTVSAGAVMIYLADASGRYQAFNHLRQSGALAGQQFGSSLLINDVNLDLLPDLTIGATNPSGGGSVFTYYSEGQATFSRLRRFTEPVVELGSEYGTSFTRADLNNDGSTDLVVGAPAAGVGAVGQAGALHVHLDTPPAPARITPARALVAITGSNARRAQFAAATSISGSWNVVGNVGSIATDGSYTPPTAISNPLDNTVQIRMAAGSSTDHWALARVSLAAKAAALTAPQIILPTTVGGPVRLGLPEEGINFGSVVGIAPLGRFSTDQFGTMGSVVAGFRAVNTGIIPRLNSYPYDDLPDTPFGGLQPYPTAGAERTGWGSQVVSGDFDGDGFTDLAISAPFGSSEAISGQKERNPQAQIGFIDLYFLDQGGDIDTFIDTGLPRIVRLSVPPTATNLTGQEIWPVDPANPTAPRLLANTRWGYTLLADDLNQDGRTDLIVGAPHADVGGVRDAGLIEILLAPVPVLGSGLSDWRGAVERLVITEPTPRQAAYFGTALAVGDLSGDGKRGLFIGAPGRDPEGVQSLLHTTGAVYGFQPQPLVPANPASNWQHGGAIGLQSALLLGKQLTIADPGTPPEGHFPGFGSSLLLADLVLETAPASPADELLISAPFRTVTNGLFLDPFGNRIVSETGDVSIYSGSPGFTVGTTRTITPPLRQLDMRFGQTMVAARLTAGQPLSLVVGAPFASLRIRSRVGALFSYDAVPNAAPVYRSRIEAPAAQGQEAFGSALAAGDLNNDGIDELVVGAPNTNIEQYIGFTVVPGRFGGLIRLFDRREQAGVVHVIFPRP